MTDTKTTTFDPSKIKEAGPVVRGDFSNQQQQQSNGNGAAAAATVTDPPETDEAKAARELAEKNKLPDVSDEQLKKLLEGKGVTGFENFDSLKEKIAKADAPAHIEPTEEEKKAAALAEEKRMLDRFIADGGTPEGFVALKTIASMDLRELSIAEITKELKEAKFTDDEIKVVLQERYYQLNPDELKKNKTWDETENKWIEESDDDFNKRKEFLKKKVSAFSPKLEKRGTHTKQNAEGILNGLREALKAEDLAQKTEEQISSKVDDISKKFARKVTFELGEVNKTKLDPVVYDVVEADITEVAKSLKDPATRKQLFINEDKTLNLDKLFEIMLRNKILESSVKTSFIEGRNQTIAAFEKVFPGAAHALGVGGAPQNNNKGRPGVIVSAGAPEVARPSK